MEKEQDTEQLWREWLEADNAYHATLAEALQAADITLFAYSLLSDEDPRFSTLRAASEHRKAAYATWSRAAFPHAER